eukprot:scaffold124575_cov24-Tisochrysis_lutea.AAC.1
MTTDTYQSRLQQHSQPTQPQHTKDPPRGRSRAHTNSYTSPPQRPATRVLTPDAPHPAQEPQSDDEQETMDTDANLDLSFHQEGTRSMGCWG